MVQWLVYLPLNPRFVGSNLAEDNGFLRAIKMCSTTSFKREVKPSATCQMILWLVKEP
jgi:hypothetical protein